MTDQEKREAFLDWINHLEGAEHEIDDMPPRVALAINELMRLEKLPAGTTGVSAESVADLSRSFTPAQSIGLIPPTVRRYLFIKARTL